MPTKYPISNLIAVAYNLTANEDKYEVSFNISNLQGNETLIEDTTHTYADDNYAIFPYRVGSGPPGSQYGGQKIGPGPFHQGHVSIVLIIYEENGKKVVEAEAMETKDGEEILK